VADQGIFRHVRLGICVVLEEKALESLSEGDRVLAVVKCQLRDPTDYAVRPLLILFDESNSFPALQLI
jgi:hypothetical protein